MQCTLSFYLFKSFFPTKFDFRPLHFPVWEKEKREHSRTCTPFCFQENPLSPSRDLLNNLLQLVVFSQDIFGKTKLTAGADKVVIGIGYFKIDIAV